MNGGEGRDRGGEKEKILIREGKDKECSRRKNEESIEKGRRSLII